jgi:hypothetical protein
MALMQCPLGRDPREWDRKEKSLGVEMLHLMDLGLGREMPNTISTGMANM